MSTEIHATVDVLGNPIGFHPTAGQAHDLEGADALLPDTPAECVIGDRAFDARARVIEPLLAAGKKVVIPSTRARKQPRDYDRHLYQARHLIKNFLARLRQYRALATRYGRRTSGDRAGNPAHPAGMARTRTAYPRRFVQRRDNCG